MFNRLLLFLNIALLPLARGQQPPVPVNPPTPSAEYKYSYNVIAQSGPVGQTTPYIGVLLDFDLSDAGSVAYKADLSGKTPHRGLFLDGEEIAQNGKVFHGKRQIIELKDILGFDKKTNTLYFLATTPNLTTPNGPPQIGFFGSDGSEFIPDQAIGGCTPSFPVPGTLLGAYSPVLNDFLFDATTVPTTDALKRIEPGDPYPLCGYAYFTRSRRVSAVKDGTFSVSSLKGALYKDQVYYIAATGGNELHLFAEQHEIVNYPEGSKGFDVSSAGNVLIATKDGIASVASHSIGTLVVPNNVKVGKYQCSDVSNPLQTAAGLFFSCLAEVRTPTKVSVNGKLMETFNVSRGVGTFTKDGPVFPAVQEPRAPWNLHLDTNVLFPSKANDKGQVLASLTIGGRMVLMLAKPTGKSAAPEKKCPVLPQPDDLVLYYGADDKTVTHAAVIAPNGVEIKGCSARITKVISKWGPAGLYGHDPDDTADYGKNWKVFHTTRPLGNKLKMLNKETLLTDLGKEVHRSAPDIQTSVQEATQFINGKCPGLYALLDKEPLPQWPWYDPKYWPMYDCRGFVFTPGLSRIPSTYFGSDQMEEIRNDNGYIPITGNFHTGGHGCGVRP